MTDMKTPINISAVIFLLTLSLLAGCASPPPKQEENYWQQVANAHMVDGLRYYQRQQFHQALNQFGQALNSYRRYNDIEGELNSHINLAKASVPLNQLDVAEAQITAARQLIQRHGFNDKTVLLDIIASSMAIQKFALTSAAEILDKYTDISTLPENIGTALLVNKIRLAFIQQRDASSLLTLLEQRVVKQPAYQPRLWRFQAQLADEQKKYSESDSLYERALEQYRGRADSIGVMATARDWGESFVLRGDWSAAQVEFEDMYRTAVSVRLGYWTGEALERLVLVYRKLGDWEKVEWAKGKKEKLEKGTGQS